MHALPKEILGILETLEAAGFEAFVVGGCVRDLLRGVPPHDWDVTTNATPEEIQRLFSRRFYDNAFGTVTVLTESDDPALKEVQITPYRIEERYSDARHPDEIAFTRSLEEDLARRDFTVNTIALRRKDKKEELRDPFGGAEDIAHKVLRAVGDPVKRFSEDALRLMRAVRLAATLEYEIEERTSEALSAHAGLLQVISKERIRDELVKIISSPRAAEGVALLQKTGLLHFVIPELEEGVGVGQNKHHIYTIFEHNVRSLAWAAHSHYNLEVRLAALLHDVAKPRTKRGEGYDSTFHGHDVVGAKMTLTILDRLRFPKKTVEKVALLVRWHLFYYNVGEVTERSVRRLLVNVGPENMEELLQVRMCDRKGSGVPKAEPYKLRHLRFMIEKVSRDPLSVTQMAIRGNDLMEALGISSGPRVGYLLQSLFQEVLEDPEKNGREKLLARARELNALSDEELKAHAQSAKSEVERRESEEEQKIKGKHWVK